MAQRRRALSMIELTIVILILGLTAAIAAPHFAATVRATRLRSAAIQLAAHVDHVRHIALNRAGSTTLVCDNVLNSYRCTEVDFPDRPGTPLEVLIGEVHDSAFELTANFDGETSLSFNFEGVPEAGTDSMVSGSIVLSCDDDAYEVSIAPGTGETTVTRLDASPGNIDALSQSLESARVEIDR